MDAYLVSKCFAEWTALGGVADTTPITDQNILSIFNKMMEDMDEERVPQQGRVLYVTPAIHRILKETEAIGRSIDLRNRATSLTTLVTDIDNVRLEMVPSVLMRTAYNFTEGARPAVTSRQINMLLGHNSAVATPVKYTSVRLDAPAAISDDKWIYFERAYEDVFVLQHKRPALAFHIT